MPQFNKSAARRMKELMCVGPTVQCLLLLPFSSVNVGFLGQIYRVTAAPVITGVPQGHPKSGLGPTG